MARILLVLPDYDYNLFKQVVGEGNVSATLRSYIKSAISSQKKNTREPILRKRLILLESEKQKIDRAYIDLKNKITAIDEKRKLEELERLNKAEKDRKKQKKIEGDTLKANLSKMV